MLSVENNPAHLALMVEILDDADRFTLISARKAELGLDMARAAPPDIILVNIKLPGGVAP